MKARKEENYQYVLSIPPPLCLAISKENKTKGKANLIHNGQVRTFITNIHSLFLASLLVFVASKHILFVEGRQAAGIERTFFCLICITLSPAVSTIVFMTMRARQTKNCIFPRIITLFMCTSCYTLSLFVCSGVCPGTL